MGNAPARFLIYNVDCPLQEPADLFPIVPDIERMLGICFSNVAVGMRRQHRLHDSNSPAQQIDFLSMFSQQNHNFAEILLSKPDLVG